VVDDDRRGDVAGVVDVVADDDDLVGLVVGR
jgi:hypothetical protein